MPMFNSSAPKAPSTLRREINESKSLNYKKPIGTIGECRINGELIEYGYDGDSYYLCFGFFGTLAFGRMKMTFDQAKAAYDAVVFGEINIDKWDYDQAKKALKEARKNKKQGDDLMSFFLDVFEDFNA